EQDRHAEFHAELGLQLVLRAVMDQRVRHVAVGAHPDLHDIPRPDVVVDHEAAHESHAGMSERAARMRLDGDAGKSKSPGVPEPALDGSRIVAAAGSLEEAAV